jgi:PAS domain S-box-containing protein
MSRPNVPTDEMLSWLIEQTSDQAMILLDPAGVILAWLAGSENIFGYTADEVIGKPFIHLFTPEDRAKHEPEKELSIGSAGSVAEDDRWMLRKDGSRFWATGFLQAILAPDGQLAGYGKLLRNRTDLKSRLESQEHQADDLRAADERKNRFISTLSHELRNPLQSLVMAAELLPGIVRPGEEAEFAMALIRRQLDAMQRMVDDMLDITRVSKGKVKLNLEVLALNDVIRAAAETCRPAIDNRTHRVHMILGDIPIYVHGDVQRLQQVFINLIENAAKYTEDGGNIWVKLIAEGQEAVAKIEDDGIGISPEMLPRIFELFTQAEFSSESKAGGLGIGLSLVKEITELHGGSVQVRSDGMGKGSDFTIRLPLASEDRLRPDSPSGVDTRH